MNEAKAIQFHINGSPGSSYGKRCFGQFPSNEIHITAGSPAEAYIRQALAPEWTALKDLSGWSEYLRSHEGAALRKAGILEDENND